jgi:hypothetical protein
MKSEKNPGQIFRAFLGTFVLETVGIVIWPLHAAPLSYAFALFQLFLAGYVCL